MTTDKPEPTIPLRINGVDHQLLMTFGLLNRLLKKAGDHIESLVVGGVPEIRDQLFAEALNKRGRSGCLDNFTAEMVDDIDMDSETGQRLLHWITEHILDFFVSVAEKTKATEQKYEGRTLALTPSNNSTPA